MTELSPAAQAIIDAFWKDLDCGDDFTLRTIAAAIRAVADQAHPKAHIEDINYVHQNYVDGWKDALDLILAAADELKGQ
jgi:hypothetical protein